MLKLGQYNKSQKLLVMGNYHQIDVCEWRLSDLLVQSASTCLSVIQKDCLVNWAYLTITPVSTAVKYMSFGQTAEDTLLQNEANTFCK